MKPKFYYVSRGSGSKAINMEDSFTNCRRNQLAWDNKLATEQMSLQQSLAAVFKVSECFEGAKR